MPPPPPPPPPNDPYGQGPGAMPPPGYVAAGAGSPIRPSAGLSKAMIALYWGTTAASFLLAFAFFRRKSVFDDFINGEAGFSKLDDADTFVGTAALLQVALTIAAVILTCLWSKRIADNAKARGVGDVSPGMAAGGWWIPIGWFWLGFKELRKSARGVGAPAPSLNVWQGIFIAQAVVSFVTRSFNDFDIRDDNVSDTLRTQGIVGIIAGVVYIAATIYAAKATKELDRGVTGG